MLIASICITKYNFDMILTACIDPGIFYAFFER